MYSQHRFSVDFTIVVNIIVFVIRELT